MMNPNEKILFSDEPEYADDTGRPWKIMLVDDEHSIHEVTRLALSGFRFDDRPLQFVSVYSGQEARQAIVEHPDTALIMLDVVMENETAGLEVARFIREEVCNNAVRIVLRTGQPGQAPERDVIARYDINDYKEKTELTSRKLSTLMYASLRSYRDIVELERNKRGLEAVIEASARIFELQSPELFTQGVLEQLSVLVQAGRDNPNCQTDALAVRRSATGFDVTGALGRFLPHVGSPLSQVRSRQIQEALSSALARGSGAITEDSYTGLIRNREGVERLLYLRAQCGEPSELDRSLLGLFERNVAIAFENVDLLNELEQTQSEMVYILGETIETRSNETGHHVKRVAEISKLIALEYGLSEEEAEIIRFASPLHDIGKIGIPDAILNKPGKLTADEWDIMKTHTTLGYDMLKSSRRRVLQAGAIIARDHHEKWVGGGYPSDKSGEDIHLYGRITAVADVFDALGSERCYKHAWPLEDILSLMHEERGRHFEPQLVDILLSQIDRVQEINKANRD
ncbi:response regulator [Roseibium sp. M-1]